MASSKKLGNEEEGNTKMKNKKKLDNWKFPKIPVGKVYKKKIFRFFPSYSIIDFEKTITIESSNQDVSLELLGNYPIDDLFKKKHNFFHLGLVQIAIKPLIRDGLEAPIIVSLTDNRHHDYKASLLAMVESNICEAPFHFHCFPSFAVSCLSEEFESVDYKVLTLNIKTSGVPLALTYRVVGKAMVDLSSEALVELTLGETTYYQAITGVSSITKWDQVSVPERWTTRKAGLTLVGSIKHT